MTAFHNWKLRALLSTILLCFAHYSYSQPRPLSLVEYVATLKNHMPSILGKKAQLNQAQAGVADTRHSFLPNAFIGDQINLGTDNSLPGSYLSYGIIPSTSSGLHSSNNYQSAVGNIAIFQSQYLLFDFGLKKARMGQAKALVNLSQRDLDRETYLLEWQTCKLYFEILRNQFQLAIDRQNVLRNEAIFSVIEAVTRSGIKPGADSSLAIAELSKSRTIYNQTLGRAKQMQQQMSYLTGIPADQVEVDTSQAKNYLATLRVIAAGSYADSGNNPLTAYYASRKLLDLQNEELVKKSYLPRVFLTATAWARGSSIDYNNEYKALSEGLGYQRFNYLAGATMVYDLFNGLHRKDKLTESHFGIMASDFDLQQQELNIRNIGLQADEAIQTAIKNLLEVPIQIRSSEDTYNQKTAQYKAGIISLIDLTNASFVLYRAQTDYVETLSDWLLANLDKAASTGNIESFIQSIK